MSFILRAAVVIGLLSYFAAEHRHAAEVSARIRTLPEAATAVARLPVSTREAAAHAVAVGLGQLSEPSRDTLADGDRRPAWRGIEAR